MTGHTPDGLHEFAQEQHVETFGQAERTIAAIKTAMDVHKYELLGTEFGTELRRILDEWDVR